MICSPSSASIARDGGARRRPTASRPRSVSSMRLARRSVRVGRALDVAELLEVGDQLGHRLLGHVGLLGQVGEPDALGRDVGEDLMMGGPQVAEAARRRAASGDRPLSCAGRQGEQSQERRVLLGMGHARQRSQGS